MNEEMLKKLAGGVKSPEEVLAIVKEYGKEITLEQAKELFDKLNATASTGELSDDVVEAVAGGNIIDDYLSWIGSLFGK